MTPVCLRMGQKKHAELLLFLSAGQTRAFQSLTSVGNEMFIKVHPGRYELLLLKYLPPKLYSVANFLKVMRSIATSISIVGQLYA